MFERSIKENMNKAKEIICLVSGNKKYIYEINKLLNKFIENNNGIKIKIINCFEASEVDDDISEILGTHQYILNTSGIHKIEDVFEEYKNKKAN